MKNGLVMVSISQRLARALPGPRHPKTGRPENVPHAHLVRLCRNAECLIEDIVGTFDQTTAEYIAQLIATAPPLSASQRDRLAIHLRPGR